MSVCLATLRHFLWQGRLALVLALAPAQGIAADTTGTRLLFVGNAAPFSSVGSDGKPEGYVVTLCERIASAVRPGVAPVWQEATIADGIERLARGEADLLCGPVTDTVEREQYVDFTSPIGIGGTGAVLRPGAPGWLLRLLGGEAQPTPPKALLATLEWPRRIAVIRGSSSAAWLNAQLASAKVGVESIPVADYDEAAHRLLTGDVGAWVGEWAVLSQRASVDTRLAAMTLISRPIVGEPLAIALRPDRDLRHAVQAALSAIMHGPDLAKLASGWFGERGHAQVSTIQSVTPRLEQLP